MVYVVLEDLRAPLFTNKICASFPSTATKHITKACKTLDTSLYKSRPILCKTWLVLVDKDVPFTRITALLANSNVTLILYSSQAKSASLYAQCMDYTKDVKVVNVLSPPRELVLQHICEELSASEKEAVLLYKHCNGYLPYIEEAIHILAPQNIALTPKVLDVLVPKVLPVDRFKLFYHLVGIQKVPSRLLTEYMYQFRYAYKYFHDELKELFNVCVKIYYAIQEGRLGQDNIEAFCREESLSVSLYFVRRIYNDVFPQVSLRDIFILRYQVSKAPDFTFLYSLFLDGR